MGADRSAWHSAFWSSDCWLQARHCPPMPHPPQLNPTQHPRTWTKLFRASSRVSTWIFLPSTASTSQPDHQVMLVDFLIRLSPIQPEMGSTGTLFSTKSGFQPTRTSMWRISEAISL